MLYTPLNHDDYGEFSNIFDINNIYRDYNDKLKFFEHMFNFGSIVTNGSIGPAGPIAPLGFYPNSTRNN